MSLMEHEPPYNAEGYCPECDMPLGIDGICHICAVKDIDIRDLLKRVTICQRCGRPKTHHRLYGYKCDNPDCAE